MSQDAQVAPAAEPEAPADEYAIVEIMGHRKHVGRIREVERFGSKMLQVDVPTDGDFAKGFVSHFYAGGAIFGVTYTDLATVERANKPYEPFRRYIAPPDEDGDESGDGPAEQPDDGEVVF
jgi:hypothetical protein